VDDAELLTRIPSLVDAEHRLEGEPVGGAIDGASRARLSELEVALDQCWDLRRPRRTRRPAGEDPDAAGVGPAPTVEGYQQ
jgi:hypothetical protein